MAILDAQRRTIEAKVVYYGTAVGGKTTNLLALHKLIEPDQKQKLVSLNTSGDRTLFFDLLPIELGRVFDFRIRLKLYSVPGQAEYNETRRVVLANADAIVFVADSDPSRAEENRRSVNFFKHNMKQNHLDAETIPMVFQYNKRDLSHLLPIESLEKDLNWRHAPYFPAIAIRGEGVLETFETVLVQLCQVLLARYATRARSTVAPAEVQKIVHSELAPLFARREAWGTVTTVGPGMSSGHVVVHSDTATASGEANHTGPMDNKQLLEEAIEGGMHFLNELLSTQESANHQPVAKEAPFALDPGPLLSAISDASRGADLSQSAAPLLRIAADIAKVEHGSVLILTAGEGPLGLVSKLGHEDDPLNRAGAFGGSPPARKLATASSALYGPDLVRTVLGSSIMGPAALVPYVAVPMLLARSRVGVLLLYADSNADELDLRRRQAIEAIAMMLATVLGFRGLERRLAAMSRPAATG